MAIYRLDGNNLFTTYGVKVLQSIGNLDFLKRKGKTSENWLDEDGEEEYVLANDIYYQPRDINLTCMIRAANKTTMLTNLSALKAVLESAGLHTLFLGTTGVTHSIYFKDGGKIRPITKWDGSTIMAASFVLKLREPDPVRS